MMTESEEDPSEGIPQHLLNEDYALALYLQTSDAFEDSFDPTDEVRAGVPFPETPRFDGGGGGGGGIGGGGGGHHRPPPTAGFPPPSSGLSIIDPQWEVIDPNPDIHALFIQFNHRFFWGRLEGVEVKWSPRMTLCAGVCSYEGRGGLCSVRLSVPLLKLRPRKDLIETLLHEMIHAYLFVTANNRDRDGHGPEFQKHMNRINVETGTRISIYHSFHDEVDVYRQHWWRCDGVCRQRKPFFGYVKRSMNRAPGPNDNWWSEHSATCRGTFTKVKEPENYKNKNSSKTTTATTSTSTTTAKDSINNKLKSDSAFGSKGKGKGKGSSSSKRNNNNNNNNNGNTGLDIRTLFSQQQQSQQQQQNDVMNSEALNNRLTGNDADAGFPSLVDKENLKNAAFSGFGQSIFKPENGQVAPIESKPWLRRFDSSSTTQSSTKSSSQQQLQQHQQQIIVASVTTATTTITTTTTSRTTTNTNGMNGIKSSSSPNNQNPSATTKSTTNDVEFRSNDVDDDDDDDLMDFMASVLDENNANNTLSASPPPPAPPPPPNGTATFPAEKTREMSDMTVFGGSGVGSGGSQRQERTPPPPIPEAISVRQADDEKIPDISSDAHNPPPPAPPPPPPPPPPANASSSTSSSKPLFGGTRSTRSAGPRISSSTTATSGRWDPAHDILSDSDSDEEKLFAKLDASIDRRRRGKRLKRSRSLDAKEASRGRGGDEGSRSRSPRARVAAPTGAASGQEAPNSLTGAIPKKSWAAKKRDPAARAVPVRSRSVENSPKAKRSRTHSPSSTGGGGGSGPRPSSSRDSSSTAAGTSSGFFGHFSGRRSFDTDAIHTMGGARQKKRPFGGSAVSSFHFHSASADHDRDPFSASTSPRPPSAVGDARPPHAADAAFFFGGGGVGGGGVGGVAGGGVGGGVVGNGLQATANLPPTSRLSNSAPDVNNIASVHDHRSTASSGRDAGPPSAAAAAAAGSANLNGNFADDDEAALREAIRLSQLQIKDNRTPSDDDGDDDDDISIVAEAPAAAPLPGPKNSSSSRGASRHRIHSASSSTSSGGVGGGGRPFSWSSIAGSSAGSQQQQQQQPPGVASTSRGGSSMTQLLSGGSGGATSTSRAGGSLTQQQQQHHHQQQQRGGSSSAASTSRAGSSMVQLPVFSPIGEAEFARKTEPRVPCPVCAKDVEQSQINAHLDMCLK